VTLLRHLPALQPEDADMIPALYHGQTEPMSFRSTLRRQGFNLPAVLEGRPDMP
jgi:hypothetical protein